MEPRQIEQNKIEVEIGKRYYHYIFGWCTVTHPPTKDKVLVDLEADEIEYYTMGEGYKTYKYVPYGPLFKTLPYLIRRLYENYDIMKHK